VVQGILNINKPRGKTSFAVVSLVRRLTGEKRVGHAGTLDPIADGVLPVCLGGATRIVEYLVDAPKAYRGAVRLGVATATYDGEGQVTATGDARAVTRADVEAALLRFTGRIQQFPPAYSAVKHQGKALYRYAREGKEAPREARTVNVYRIELLRFEPPTVELEIECGRGTYVRSIAHDLGQLLGCGGHLEALTRLRSGPFTIEDAMGLDELESAVRDDTWRELLLPPDRVLESWQAALLEGEHSLDVRNGRLVLLAPLLADQPEPEPEAPCRAYSSDGEFLAILRYRGGTRWQPEKVFAAR
jgi:tRNA pseudouridine55 synthase